MHVKTYYFYGDLDGEIHTEQPERFIVNVKEIMFSTIEKNIVLLETNFHMVVVEV